jgi:2-dehydropantoate 2-reductase
VIVGIVGAGGIGSYYAGLLRRAGTDVRLLARGDHLAAIKERGLEIRVPGDRWVVTLEASSDDQILHGCDYVIVSVKGYSLDEVAPGIARAAKAGAVVVPLLNGVDAAERLAGLGVPRSAIIGGLAKISVFRTAPGVVERKSTFYSITLGEFDRAPRERTTALVDEFKCAGSAAILSNDIGLDLWRKFAFIVPMTVACGLSREPAGRVFATARGRGLVIDSLHEIVEVSRRAGSALSDEDEALIGKDLFALSPEMFPSFYLDLVRGGPAETETLAGAVSRLGHASGVPTPIHDVATAAFTIATQPKS